MLHPVLPDGLLEKEAYSSSEVAEEIVALGKRWGRAAVMVVECSTRRSEAEWRCGLAARIAAGTVPKLQLMDIQAKRV